MQNILQLPYWMIPVALVFIFSGHLANALRWYILLRSQKINLGYWTTLKIVLSGAFASNFLPSTIGGDTLRIVGILHHTEKRGLAVSSIFLDRVLNVIAMVFLLPISWFVFASHGRLLNGEQFPDLRFVVAFTWAQKIYNQAKIKLIVPLIESMRAWAKHPYIIVVGLLVSWLSLIVVFIGVWMLALGLKMPVAFHEVIAISSIVYILTLIPISINGYGVREIAVTALYAQLGATLEQATTLALITRLLALLATLPGALWIAKVVSGQPKSRQSTNNQNNTI